MVLESLSRGVPVLGANVGGLHEAMLGVPYLLPVNPVTRYQGSVDEHMVPVAQVPPQNVGPWVDALRRLTTDRGHWEKLSALSREKALHYMENLNVLPFEAYCESLLHRPKRGAAVRPAGAGPLAGLSSDRRRLLELRLQERAAWMPAVPAQGRRVFCFPWAGAGPLAYRGWQEKLGREFAVIPIRLPQREWAGIGDLVEQLARQVKPLLTEDAVFFGHSMGAGLAFEVARRVAPARLVVSAARAPKFRIGYVPPAEPSDAELLAQLERLGGAPRERLAALLPAFRRDTRLFRRWVYEPGELLTAPVVALGGAEDPQVTAEHLAPWGEVTAGSFSQKMFAGGHFYFQTEEAFFAELARLLSGGPGR
jgi:medium-chain acyl-[acyl-carrier-protein] hydrolase